MLDDMQRNTKQDQRSLRPPLGLWMIRIAVGLSVLAMLLLAGAGYLWLKTGGSGEQVAIGQAAIGGPFTLVNAAGKPVTDRDLLGKYLLVYFGYTYCPDVCPTTLATVANALDKLSAKADRVQPLFITVDPKRDTPSVVGRYTAAFGPRLMGLTGTSEQIAAAEKEYRIYAAEHRTGPGPNDYGIDHSSILYLMGPDGHFIAPIRADQDATAMATDIAGHLR